MHEKTLSELQQERNLVLELLNVCFVKVVSFLFNFSMAEVSII